MDSTFNIGSIGIAGPPLRGPSSPRLLAEPPLSPPVSGGTSQTASAQPLEPPKPLQTPIPPFAAETVQQPAPTFEPAPREPAPLESLLIRFRLITPDQLDEAMREKTETGKDVGAIVVERGWVNEDQLARMLSYAPALSPPAAALPAPVEHALSAPAADEVVAETVEPESREEPIDEAATAAEVVEQPEEAKPVVEPFPAWRHEVAPALELVETEPSEAEPVAEAAEVTAEPAAVEPLAELAPIAPVVKPEAPAVQDPAPFAQTVPAPALETVSQPEPETVEEPEPTQLAPVAPAPAEVPAPVEQDPEPVEQAAPVAAAEPQVVQFVEPSAIETIAKVFVRLSNGERVEAGSFDDVSAAKNRAEEVMQQVSNGDGGWPFYGGRYIRPDAIVSVDLDTTIVRYA